MGSPADAVAGVVLLGFREPGADDIPEVESFLERAGDFARSDPVRLPARDEGMVHAWKRRRLT